jgi:hypothetical protein
MHYQSKSGMVAEDDFAYVHHDIQCFEKKSAVVHIKKVEQQQLSAAGFVFLIFQSADLTPFIFLEISVFGGGEVPFLLEGL